MSARPLALMAALSALAVPAAYADTVYFEQLSTKSGTYGQNGKFTGSLTVTAVDADTARVSVSLTNTSASGWYLVGFGMNAPTGSKVNKMTFTGDKDFPKLVAIGQGKYDETKSAFRNKVSTGRFGNLDFGFGLNGQWHTSGTLTDGIAPGQTGDFTFDLDYGPGGGVTARSIWDAQSTGGDGGTASLALRFRKSGHSAGDKIEAREVPAPVPAPAGVVLAGVAAVAGLGLRRRLVG